MKTIHRSNLQLEVLEARDCPSGRPAVPQKVMVITDGGPYYSHATINSLTTLQQQNSYADTGILKSQNSGKEWSHLYEFRPGKYSMTLSGIGSGDQAFSDYGHWRQRFGTGI